MSVLQQIIQDMYIDPELLEQLGEEQKQILFRKIREEQIKRWQIKEGELEKAPPKKTPRKINFILGSDGKPWVWVMGEHKDDLPYDEIINQREIKKQEDENLAEIMEAEKLAKDGIMIIRDFEGAGALNRAKVGGLTASESPQLGTAGFIRTESQLDTSASIGKQSASSRREKFERRKSIMGETPEEQKKFEQEQVAEVLGTLRRSKSIAKKRAAEMAKRLEDNWKESQRKAEVYDRSRRRSFKIARELTEKTPNIHEKILDELPSEKKKEIIRKLSVVKKPTRPAPPPPRKKLLKMTSFVQQDSTPKTAAHAVKWFKETEAPKGVGKQRDGSISIWFHGKTGREAASKTLENEPIGSYLVRLSAKLWGYTVSVKTLDGSRHFLVDASSGQYNFLGPKQQKFRTLTALLEFYKKNPITWDGREVLLLPVALEDERGVYGGLYSDDDDDDDDDGSML